jgi:N6-adenosine-specific RNA methylase IME4
MNGANSLVIFERASVMLAEANTIQKAKELKELSLTAADFARRKNMGEDAVAHCRGYALEAERRMGELLAETERAKGVRTIGGDKRSGGTMASPPESAPTLAALGIKKRESAEAQLLASVPRATFEEVKSGKKSKTNLKREERQKKRERKRQANAAKVVAAKKPEELGGLFSTIVIDPPWDWGDEGDVNQLGRARADFATMPIGELERLPVGKLSSADAHLYLWITNGSLVKGFRLLEAWGFRHVTMLTWPKTSFGMGNYFRGQTEHVLFGVRGSMPLKRKDASTLLPAWARGKGGHSSKPREFYGFVESCSPGPYLEMFSRGEREGWTMWGEGQ